MNTTRHKKVPKIYSVSLEKKKTYTLPAGKYFVGDPSYFLQPSISNSLAAGHYALPDGRGFILVSSDNGWCRGSNGGLYGVESGLIGICSYEIGDYSNFTGDGTFHTFSSEISTELMKDGVLRIKSGDFTLDLDTNSEYYHSDDDGYDSCG